MTSEKVKPYGLIMCQNCEYLQMRISQISTGEIIFCFTDATDPKNWDGRCARCSALIWPKDEKTYDRRQS